MKFMMIKTDSLWYYEICVASVGEVSRNKYATEKRLKCVRDFPFKWHLVNFLFVVLSLIKNHKYAENQILPQNIFSFK